MSKKVLLPVEVYETPSGFRTCGSNFQKGDVCRFLGSSKFGSIAICLASKSGRIVVQDNGSGFLIPSPDCPLIGLPTNED